MNLRRSPIPALAAVAATALIAGCSSNSEPAEGGPGLGNATPVPAAPTQTEPAGTVTETDLKVTDAAFVNDTVALRAGDTLLVGPAKDVAAGNGERMTIQENCQDLEAGIDSFVLACPGGVQIISTEGKVDNTLSVGEDGEEYSAATMLANGNVLAAVADSRVRRVFSPDNSLEDNFKVSEHANQLVRIPLADGGERVLEANRPNSSIHGMVLPDSKAGAALRAGSGLGQLVPAGPGTALATDTIGSQLLVYTTYDILRLNMSREVPAGPWAVLWDDTRNLAWVASTEGSVLTAWNISTGVPIKAASLDLLADGQTLVSDGDGGMIVASATGAGIQHISAADVDKAVKSGKKAFEADMQKERPEVGSDAEPASTPQDN